MGWMTLCLWEEVVGMGRGLAGGAGVPRRGLLLPQAAPVAWGTGGENCPGQA